MPVCRGALRIVEYIHLLDLIVGHVKTELLHPRLDRVPSSQTRDERNISGHAEVGRIKDLVGAGVVEDRLGCGDR